MMGYFTPLRYPGGKGKLSKFVKAVFEANDLLDGHYVEPYAGGAGVACELLLQDYVSHIHINDLNRSIYSFWYSLINHTEELCRLIVDTPVTVEEWHRQKLVQTSTQDPTLLELGFSTFFLNRTNRSGILNGGIIGGKQQQGQWKIDARYNASQLVERILDIAERRDDISVYNLDAACFIESELPRLPSKTLVFFDPPYYEKGKELYDNFYKHGDHQVISSLISNKVSQRWMVSYDDVKPIQHLYSRFRNIKYSLNYSARHRYKGVEIVFFCDDLVIPPPEFPMHLIG